MDYVEQALNVGYERIWLSEIRVKFLKVGKILLSHVQITNSKFKRDSLVFLDSLRTSISF